MTTIDDDIRPGRKPVFDTVKLITTSAGLTRDQFEYAKKLGKGNVRSGIRIALDWHRARARRANRKESVKA